MTLVLTLLAFLLAQAEKPVILAVGDSMTAGFGIDPAQSYPAQLERELARLGFNYRVVNYGVTASSSIQILSSLNRGLILSPEIVIIQSGGNDRSAGISEEVSRETLRRMIARLKPGHSRVFFAGGRFRFLDETARAEGIPVISFLENVEGHPELLISDGRHPNAAGYAVVVQNVLKVLEPNLRHTKSADSSVRGQ